MAGHQQKHLDAKLNMDEERRRSEDLSLSQNAKLREKLKGNNKRAKSFQKFSHFSHFFRIIPPGLSPSKLRVLAQ